MTSVVVPPIDLAPGMPSRVVTISATDVTEGGQSLEGQMVRFALSDTLDVSSGGDVIAKTQAEVILDANGEGSIRLPVYDDGVRTWCGDPDWAILVTATWGSQKAIRVPAGTSDVALSALPPVRPLRGREKLWAITGATVRVRTGSPANGSLSVNGGILDLDLTIPSGEWKRGPVDGAALDDLLDGIHAIPSAEVANALGLPTGLTGNLEKVTIDAAGMTGKVTWSPRTSPPQEWAIIRNSDGWTSWSRTDNREPSPAAFGAVGDGITDDTTALRNWLAHLASTGGSGYLDPLTYRITDTIGVINPAKPFHIRGSDVQQSRILMDSATPKTVLSIRGARRSSFTDFYVGGWSLERLAGHGVAISDSVDCTVARVRVGLYYSTAVIFFRYTESVVCENNRITDCVAMGGDIARNGFMLENCRYSYMTNCTVASLSRTETPSYGLQLKNDCRDCTISGGLVVNALAGVAFGSESDVVAQRSHVYGVTVRGCTWGINMSKTNTAAVSMLIDHSAAPAGGYPVRIGARCSGVALDLVVRNVPTDVPVVYFGSSHNSARIAPIENPPTSLVQFVPLLVGTTVIYEGLASDATVLDESGDPTNHVVGLVRDLDPVTYLGDGIYEIGA